MNVPEDPAAIIIIGNLYFNNALCVLNIYNYLVIFYNKLFRGYYCCSHFKTQKLKNVDMPKSPTESTAQKLFES